MNMAYWRSKLALVALGAIGTVNGAVLSGNFPVWQAVLGLLVILASYLVGRLWYTAADGWVMAAILAVPAVLAVPLGIPAVNATLFNALTLTLPWLSGRSRHQQNRLLEAARERAVLLESQQSWIAERALHSERERIAAEMHDALGHSLALIALRAGRLELDSDLTSPHREAAARLRAEAVTATDRMRATLGILRDRSAATPPTETIDDVVARAQSAGMNVDYTHQRPDAEIESSTARAMAGVLTEALTNAARHAPGSTARVDVTRADSHWVVTVTNDAATGPPQGRGEPGSGLRTLEARLRALGGTFQAGPHEDGFQVTARFPEPATPHFAKDEQ